MTTAHYITPETISNDATADHAIRLAEILNEMGFDSVAADTCGVTPEGFASADEIPSEIWLAAIEKMLAEPIAEQIDEPTRPECAPETIFAGCASEWVSAAVLPRFDVRWSIAGGHITLVARTCSGRIIAARSRLQEPICDGNGVYKNPDGLRFHAGEDSWVAAQDAAREYVRSLVGCCTTSWAVGVWLSYQSPRREFYAQLTHLPGWDAEGAYIPLRWRELAGRAPGTLRPQDLLEA